MQKIFIFLNHFRFLDQVLPFSNLDLKYHCLCQNDKSNYVHLSELEIEEIDKQIANIFDKEFKLVRNVERQMKILALQNIDTQVFENLCNIQTGSITFQK